VRARRAVNSLHAAIIVMALSVLGGWIMYSAASHSLSAQGEGVKIWVEDASIARDITGIATLTCTVKNVGSRPITSLTLKIWGETLLFPKVGPSRPLMPGQSASIVADLGEGFLSGESYTITVVAKGKGGGEAAEATTVKAAGGKSMSYTSS